MKELRKFLKVFGIILTIVLIIPSLFYIIIFGSGKFSNNPQIWGTFGDYFGGVLNPLLGLANLIIFIKLTLIVAENQDIATKQALSQEKKILISELMHDSAKELSFVLNSLAQKIISNIEKSEWEILNVKQTITTFGNNYSYLFKKIDTRDVVRDLNRMLNDVVSKPFNKNKFASSFEEYLNSKDIFLQSLFLQTISKLEN